MTTRSRNVYLFMFILSLSVFGMDAYAKYYCSATCKIYDDRSCGSCEREKTLTACGETEDSAYYNLRRIAPLDSGNCAYNGCNEDQGGRRCGADSTNPPAPTNPTPSDGVVCVATCVYYLSGNNTQYRDTVSGSGRSSIGIRQALENQCRRRASSGVYHLERFECEN